MYLNPVKLLNNRRLSAACIDYRMCSVCMFGAVNVSFIDGMLFIKCSCNPNTPP